jgi:cephalosporin-C deacetylase-like acetyl esterase
MNHRALAVAATLWCCLAGNIQAQPSPGDGLFDRYLTLETARLSQRFLDGAQSHQEWERRRPKLHQDYLEMLGLWPMPEKTPLQAKVTGKLERDAFVVEKLHFQSRPGLYVTGNLYLPRRIEGKLPAVLYVCGHSGRGRDGNKTAFQHHGMWFATHGYVCLIIDTLQLGEIPGIHHGTYRERRWWWQAAGYTPAGVECWNGIRALDYLQSRPEVDPQKLAVTGISGGGASTLWISAADERVKVVVPVSGISDLESYVANKVINGHCDCMFLINKHGWEWTTIAALVAPRPMLILNSGHDTIFPMPGNERQRQRLEGFYEWFKPKPQPNQPRPKTLFDIGVTPGGHSDNLELRLMAYRWINWHLKDDNREVHEEPLLKFDGKELRVFPEDKDLPTDSLNGRIDETFVPRADVKPPQNAEQFRRWHEELLSRLESKVFSWPEGVRSAELLRESKDGRLLLFTEPAMAVIAVRPARPPGKPERCWLVVLNPDEAEDTVPEWSKGLIGEKDAVLLLSPRGCGGLAWTKKSPPNYVERSHALLGSTVDAGRVWDVRATARWVHENDEHSARVRVAGRGQAGILGAYAALFEPSIEEVVAIDPPASHKEGPIFLNVLRVLDVPDALGLLAPMPLTLVNARDQGFERTVQIYRAADAEGKLTRK